MEDQKEGEEHLAVKGREQVALATVAGWRRG
jgi:hypothetical protein